MLALIRSFSRNDSVDCLPAATLKRQHTFAKAFSTFKTRTRRWSSSFETPRPQPKPKKAPKQKKADDALVLPDCSDRQIIIAMSVAEGRPDENPEDPEPLVWLAIPVRTACRNTGAWLSEHLLRSLLKQMNHFAKTNAIWEPIATPPVICRFEKHTPLILFFVASVMVCMLVLDLTNGFGKATVVASWALGAGAVITFVLGTVLYCLCVHHRESVFGEDPTTTCERFAAQWSEKHGLPLVFHRRQRGPSYFELKRPSNLDSLMRESMASSVSEGDDGWDTVRTPTATPRPNDGASAPKEER